jgi:hypothetical protein
MSAERQRRRSGPTDEPEPATGGLLAFHPPCRRCFPEDETVLRSRGTHGNRVHRPAEGGDA